MNVKVISATPYPAFVCSYAAGVCYGKDNVTRKRLQTCFNADHLSVFEHASATFSIEGISRACMAQLTRHRLASFCVQSQRYCKYDADFFNGDWYVMPPQVKENEVLRESYHATMTDYAYEYMAATANGVRPEDARFYLPEATKTNLVVTMNARQFFHLLDMRADSAAQWEIRDLARLMLAELKAEGDEWTFLMGLWERKQADAV